MSDTGIGPPHPKQRVEFVLSRAAVRYLYRQALDEQDRNGGRIDRSATLEAIIRRFADSPGLPDEP